MDLADGLNAVVPRWNFGPNMFNQPMDTTGLVEMLTPFNRTKLHDLNALGTALKATPGAATKGVSLNLNAKLANVQKSANAIVAAVRSPAMSELPTVSLKIKVPSAAGGVLPPAFQRNATSA